MSIFINHSQKSELHLKNDKYHIIYTVGVEMNCHHHLPDWPCATIIAINIDVSANIYTVTNSYYYCYQTYMF